MGDLSMTIPEETSIKFLTGCLFCGWYPGPGEVVFCDGMNGPWYCPNCKAMFSEEPKAPIVNLFWEFVNSYRKDEPTYRSHSF